jgi:hypothetical protein
LTCPLMIKVSSQKNDVFLPMPIIFKAGWVSVGGLRAYCTLSQVAPRYEDSNPTFPRFRSWCTSYNWKSRHLSGTEVHIEVVHVIWHQDKAAWRRDYKLSIPQNPNNPNNPNNPKSYHGNNSTLSDTEPFGSDYADRIQAVGQLCSTASMAHNLGLVKTLIDIAAKAGAKVWSNLCKYCPLLTINRCYSCPRLAIILHPLQRNLLG